MQKNHVNMSTCRIIMSTCDLSFSTCNIIMLTCNTICLEFIVFVWSLSRIFHSYGAVTIAGEGLRILTYARHSWPLSMEGSITCHIHCDKGLQFILVTHTCCRSFGSGAVTTCFYVCRDRGLNPDLPDARGTLYLYTTAAVAT